MKIINTDLIDSLSNEAVRSLRRRKNLNFHESLDDTLQRMLNAFEPGSYVQPHRHYNPNKREVFLILRGQMLVVIFDDNGAVTDHLVLDYTKGLFAVEIAAGEWHMLIALQPGTVVFEVKDGPYNVMDDKDFATWAPREGTQEAADYLARITSQVVG